MNQRCHLFKLCTLFKRLIICLSPFFHVSPFFGLLIFLSSCGFKVSSVGSNLLSSSESIISGVISPLVGSIAEVKTQRDFFMNSAYSAPCSDAVYAKLFRLESDGAIDETNPLSSQLVSADAKYSFDLNALNIKSTSANIEYLIKVEGCNGDVYKRPVTSFDDKQDLDARTTVVSEVINSNTLLTTTLNQIDKKDIEALINSVTGSSITSALSSLTETGSASTNFKKLFGVNPSVLLSAKPEVQMISPKVTIHELGISTFSVSTFHVDPNYSFAYSWKIDGVVKSTAASMNYIPSANDSGTHQVDLYVGLNDGTGLIDTTKPYYTKSTSISVYNTIVATPPNFSINSANPTPVNTNSILIDLATGVNKANCASFSHMAITDSATPPGIMQFSIDCLTSGTQTESITFTSGDGAKTLYLWAIDNEGNISAAKTISLVLDTLAPAASLSFSPSAVRGGATQSISLSASDAGSGLNTLDLYYSNNNGSTYSLLSNLGHSDTTYSWSVPVSDINQAKLKLVATDLTGLSTTLYSSVFEIDSAAPTAPTIARSSSAISNSTTVAINTTCSGDYHKILYSQTSSTPSLTDASWETCSSTKNFTVTSGDALKTIYAFTKDAVGNISASSVLTMTLDTAAPSAPLANLTSASVSSSTAATFTISDCTDRPYVFVSESVIAPAASDSGWQSCVTNASAITYTLVGPVLQSSHTLYIYAKDAVGNVGPATSASMIYDTTNPTLTLSTSLGLLYKGGDILSLSFGSSDTNGLSSLKLEYTVDGSSYSLVTNLSTSATTYNWTVPASNTTTAKLRLVSTDNATTANTTTVYSDEFTVDSTAPTAPTLTRTSDAISNSTSVTMTVGSCTGTSHVLISETNAQPSVSDSAWQLCSTTASAFSKTVSGDGVHTIYAWTKDLAGNIASSANSITMTLDTTAPVIVVTTPSSMQGNVSTGSATWTLSETNVAASTNFTVEVYNGTSWVSVGTKAATAGVNTAQSYTLTNYSIPNVDVNTARVRVTLVDAGGNSTTSQSETFIIDSTSPVLNSFSINSGASSTSVSTVQIALSSQESFTNISDFCLKYSSGAGVPTAPLLSDTCWTPVNAPSPGVNPSTAITFSQFYYSLGLVTGTYKVFAWTKNTLGMISTLTNSGSGTSGVDYAEIIYNAGVPPTILNVVSANIDGHQTPPNTSELSATSGSNLYIKWKASDDNALPANAVTISYTTNESTYTTIASNLANTAGAGCTVDGTNYTGCFVATAPLSTYFKIKVTVTDSSQMSSMGNASPNNTGNFNLLAGNTELGIGGSGTSAIFNIDSGSTIDPMVGSLVVTDSGIMYLRDKVSGILKIDPQNGIVQSFIPYTGTLTNGAIGTATLKDPNAYMTLDYNNNLLIFDYDRIRKVDLTNNLVSTFIGGGASRVSGSLASSFQVSAYSNTRVYASVIPLPNGDIYFYDNPNALTSKTIWKYQASDQKVYGILPTGVGITGQPAGDDVSSSNYYMKGLALSFNVTTSAITTSLIQMHPNPCAGCSTRGYPAFINISTGNTISSPTPTIPIPESITTFTSTVSAHNGSLYLLGSESTGAKRVVKFNASTNTWTTVLGTGTTGFCADGTDAASCSVKIMDAFVTSDGRMYFTDNGLIRTIDSDNKVQTLYGQRRIFGDGGLATSSRINDSKFFDLTSTGNIVFADNAEGVIRQFTPGGNISRIAGNGTPTTTSGSLALSTGLSLSSWAGNTQMLVDRSTDDIYLISTNKSTYKIQQSDQKIYYVLGAGATNYAAADGLIGSSVSMPSPETSGLLGIYNGKLLIVSSQRNGSQVDYKCYAKLYDSADSFRQSHLAGNDNVCPTGSPPSAGVATTTADVVYATYNSQLMSEWYSDLGGWVIPRYGNASLVAYVPGGNITSVVSLPRGVASSTFIKNASNQNIVYYCASATKKIYKYNIATSTETLLAWPGASYACDGYAIKYSTTRGSVIFPYRKNGISGYAEIFDTP